jgi:hypothetical protein
LAQELSELRSKLANAAGSLAVLTEQKRVIADEIADGKPPHKPATLAALHAEIAAAELPVTALQRRVSEKEAALASTRDALATLDREIAIEAQQEARRARFDALEKQGRGVTAEVAEMLRVLVEEKLPALATVRDGLTEFINVGGQLNAGPADSEGRAARALIHELEGQFWDGSVLTVERRLLRAGWQPSGSVELTLRSLRPPR